MDRYTWLNSPLPPKAHFFQAIGFPPEQAGPSSSTRKARASCWPTTPPPVQLRASRIAEGTDDVPFRFPGRTGIHCFQFAAGTPCRRERRQRNVARRPGQHCCNSGIGAYCGFDDQADVFYESRRDTGFCSGSSECSLSRARFTCPYSGSPVGRRRTRCPLAPNRGWGSRGNCAGGPKPGGAGARSKPVSPLSRSSPSHPRPQVKTGI